MMNILKTYLPATERLGAYLLVLLGFVGNTALAAAPTNGLVAYYSFAGNYLDGSGHNLHGTNDVDVICATDRFGRTNRALGLAAGESRVELTNDIALLNILTNLTLSAWIWPASPSRAAESQSQTIIARESADGATYRFGFQLGVGTQAGKITFSLDQGAPPTRAQFEVSDVAANTWNHVVLTRTDDATTPGAVLCYVNSTNVGDSAPGLASLSSVTNATTVGASHLAMDGRVDEVRIYNRTLSSAEVIALYQAELTLAGPTLNALSPMTILEDASTRTVTLRGISSGADEVQITATSSNPGLIPDPIVNYTNLGATGRLRFRPLPNANGTTTITVTATDNGGTNGRTDTVSQQFNVIVTPVNDPPSLDPIGDRMILVNAPLQTINLTGLGAGAQDETPLLRFNVVSDNPALLPNPEVDQSQPFVVPLTFQPVAGRTGRAGVTLTVTDNDGTNNGGRDSVTRTFTVFVVSTNSPPTVVITAPSAGRTFPAATPIVIRATATDAQPTAGGGVVAVEFLADVVKLGTDTASPFNWTWTNPPSGQHTLRAIATDTGGASTTSTAVICTVQAPNQAPSFVEGTNVVAIENAGLQVITNWATEISAGPANEAAQRLTFVVTNDNWILFSAPPAVDTDGTLTFTPATNANGIANVTVVLHDDGGTNDGGLDTSLAHSFTLTLLPVNSAPTFTNEAGVTLNENAGPQSFTNWATSINPGAADEAEQQLEFIVVSNSAPTLFSVPPAVSPRGTLTFTPAPNANGVAEITVVLHDDGGTNEGGLDSSLPQRSTITVRPVNQAPTFSFVKGASVTVQRNAGPTIIPNWATDISPGPADEATQTVAFLIGIESLSTPFLFADGPHLNAAGTLSFTPAPDTSGLAVFSVALRDNGGTENRGLDTSPAKSLTITVLALANEAPGFTMATTFVVNENAGPQSVPNWATAIRPGPASEAGQQVTFRLTTDAPGLFLVPPAIDPDGTLTFTPATNANGATLVTVVLQDDGGIANGGQDKSPPQSFTLTVLPVNQAPSFRLAGTNLVVNENAGAQSITNWATTISAGPPNESAQPLRFVTAHDAPTLFSVAPQLDTDGILTFTPAPNASGLATVTVVLQDDGGVDRGGKDTSPPQSFTITVRPFNDPPTLGAINDLTILEDAGALTLGLTGIGAGAPHEEQVLSVAAFSSDPDLIANPTVNYTSPNPNGLLTLLPLPNANGTAQITVEVSDNGGLDRVSRVFLVTVTQVNDAPGFVPGGDRPPNQDAGPQRFPNWATAITAGPPNEAGQRLSFVLTNDSAALFAGPPALTPDGTLSYTPAAGANGLATVTVVLQDDGGRDKGGENASPPATFTIAIQSVNQPPTVGEINDLTIFEDAGELALTLTGISGGDGGEAQALTVTATSSNPSLVPPPTVVYTSPEASGTLTFKPVAEAFGTATITVTVSDDGGTANGGQNQLHRPFTVNVTPVNDPPTLDVVANRSLRVNAAAQALPLTGITSGRTNEIQTLSLTAVSDNPALVPDPAISYVSPAATGTLHFQPLPGQSGTALITVTVVDDGGTTNGGSDRFSRQFRVDIQANTPPTVVLAGPTNGESFAAPATVLLRANASDHDGAVVQVEFFQNGTRLGQVTNAPYEWSWSPVPAGEYAMFARATDNDGTSTDSTTVNLTVREALNVKLTSPLPGATSCPEAPLILAAAAFGPVPAGSRVEFLLDGQILERVDTVPFTVIHRGVLSGGSHEIRARLVDARDESRAETATARFTVLENCADVAVLRGQNDPGANTIVELLTGDDLQGYLQGGVDVFDQGQVTVDQLLGYKLVLWSGVDRSGAGLTDTDVNVLASLHALGRSVYLLGPQVVGDTGRLSAESRRQLERLGGLQSAGAVESAATLGCQTAGFGDPVCEGRLGVVADQFLFGGLVGPGRLAGTNGFEIKVTLAGAPVMVVSPPVGDPDLGLGRLATQTFGLAGSPEAQRLFMNTVLWLLRAWYCENFHLQLSVVEPPATGRVGEEVVYEYHVQHNGACAALGVVVSEELPPGWTVNDVEMTQGNWRREGDWLFLTFGAVDRGVEQVARVRLRPTRPGTFTHLVRVRAEDEPFSPLSHQVESTIVIEGSDLAPRLELRPAAAGGYVLSLFGAPGTTYRVQQSANLRDWVEVGSATGPEAQFPVGAPGDGIATRYLRALWP